MNGVAYDIEFVDPVDDTGRIIYLQFYESENEKLYDVGVRIVFIYAESVANLALYCKTQDDGHARPVYVTGSVAGMSVHNEPDQIVDEAIRLIALVAEACGGVGFECIDPLTIENLLVDAGDFPVLSKFV